MSLTRGADAMGLPVNTIIEVGFEGTLFNQRCLNICHYVVQVQSTAVNYLDEMNFMASYFTNVAANGFGQKWLGAVPIEYLWNHVRCQAIYPTRYRAFRKAVQQQGVGGNTTVPNVSQSLTFLTAKGGRNQVGGIRVPLSTDRCADGIQNAQAIAAADSLATALELPAEGTAQGGVYSLCIFHRSANANPRWDVVEDVLPQTTTRVVRRRTVGLGI